MTKKEYQKELNREELLHTVLNSMTEIGREKDSSQIIHLIEKLLGEILTSKWVILWFIDYSKNNFYSRVENEDKNMFIPINRGLLSKCYKEKEPFFSNYAMIEDQEFIAEVDNARNYDIKNIAFLPIKDSNNEVIAVCQAITGKSQFQSFTQKDIDLFLSIQNFIVKMLLMLQSNNIKKKSQSNHNSNSENIQSLITDIEQDYQIELLHSMDKSIKKIPAIIEQLRSNKKNTKILSRLERITQNLGLRLSIMNDMIKLPEGDRDTLNIVKVNIIKEFNFIGTLFKDKMVEKNITFQLFIDPIIPLEVEVDIQRIKETFFILLNNALYNTPQNGILKCEIRLSEDKNSLVFDVIDSGVELSADEKAVILNITQGQASTLVRHKGMYLCRYECQILNSELVIHSTSKETSFSFSIPLLNADRSKLFLDISKIQDSIITIVTSDRDSAEVKLFQRYLEAFQIDQSLSSVVSPEELTDMGYVSIIFCMTNKINSSLAQLLLDQGNILIYMDSCEDTTSMHMLNGHVHQLEISFSPIEIYQLLLQKPIQINPFAKKLLLLDGYGTLENFIIKVLEDPNLEVDSVNTSYDFLQKFNDSLDAESPYDFILMDGSSVDSVNLPSIAKNIRAKESSKKLEQIQIVAILSSDTLDKEVDKYLISGIDNVYIKPVGSRKVKEIFKDL